MEDHVLILYAHAIIFAVLYGKADVAGDYIRLHFSTRPSASSIAKAK